MSEKYGRVTVPTDVDMIEETKEIVKRWGADALRDCDGTSMPDELKSMPVKNLLYLLHDKKRQSVGRGQSG